MMRNDKILQSLSYIWEIVFHIIDMDKAFDSEKSKWIKIAFYQVDVIYFGRSRPNTVS